MSRAEPGWQVVHLHPRAAPKPPLGAPCNGCGLCCASEPCPLGVLISGRRRGACDALVWHEPTALYRCGALHDAPATLERVWPRVPGPIRSLAAALFTRAGARWIAAGKGCDCSLEPSNAHGGPPT